MKSFWWRKKVKANALYIVVIIAIVVGVLLKLNLSNKDMEKPKNEPEESYSLD